MAIYHLTVRIVSRARGQSAVAAAAYRSGASLRDERYGVTHNYVGKRGIVHSEIMAPVTVPPWVHDRAILWNRVEAREGRKDSQLARVVEVSLPIELSAQQRLALLRDYIAAEFVANGMVADFCIRGREHNPHAHILLTLRQVSGEGFGPKQRSWNGKAVLQRWRVAWAEHANEHLARAGHAVRIDSRTLEAQQIELLPGRRIGVAHSRRTDPALPAHLAARLTEQQRIAHENAETILADPSVALHALTLQRPTFTEAELGRFLLARTGPSDRYGAVLQAVKQSAELVALDSGPDGAIRFSSRDLLEAERSLVRRARSMHLRKGHGVPASMQADLAQCAWACLYEDMVGGGDIQTLAPAEPDKIPLLREGLRTWTAHGFAVAGAAPSLRAAELLEAGTGIASRTLADREAEWSGAALAGDRVLVVDGAEALSVKQLERVLAVADRSRAKAVLVAHARKLDAMRVDCAFAMVHRAVAAAPAGETVTPNVEY